MHSISFTIKKQLQDEANHNFAATGRYNKNCGKEYDPCPTQDVMDAYKARKAKEQIEADANYMKTGSHAKTCGIGFNKPCPSKEAKEAYKLQEQLKEKQEKEDEAAYLEMNGPGLPNRNMKDKE